MAGRKDLSDIKDALKGKLVRSDQPRWIPPMLATLAGRLFFDAGWIYEPKLDGIRCLAFKRGKDIQMYSRNRNPLNDRYPEIAEALREQPVEALILDGEIAAGEGDHTSFSLLQSRSRGGAPSSSGRGSVRISYYVFDILYCEGYDTTRVPLAGRKLLLEKAVSYTDVIRFVPSISDAGEKYFQDACLEGREGLIAKRADSPYTSRRSPDWLKFKCVSEQEFVVGGYTEPRGTRSGFGALLVGYYEGDDLRYAGKVGTGFNERTLQLLHRRLSAMEQDTSPFRDGIKDRGVHWVRPELIARVGFSEWTRDGRLRHPRFIGLRADIEPREVRRETPRA